MQRKKDTERCATAWPIRDGHTTTMRQNNRLRDRQAETVARDRCAKPMVAAEEWLEYLLMVYRGNAWTAI